MPEPLWCPFALGTSVLLIIDLIMGAPVLAFALHTPSNVRLECDPRFAPRWLCDTGGVYHLSPHL